MKLVALLFLILIGTIVGLWTFFALCADTSLIVLWDLLVGCLFGAAGVLFLTQGGRL
jgi:hypothetical protein